MNTRWCIVGQGLAGTCLAWEFWNRGVPFSLVDREAGGSSRVAAGLINPVTGKNFEPSKRIGIFHPEALAFYAAVEAGLGIRVWHPLPILRLASEPKEWAKIQEKSRHSTVIPWLARKGRALAVDGWLGAVELRGGGRLDTRAFLDGSRRFFHDRGVYQKADEPPDSSDAHLIWCEGAAGLIAGKFGSHRCAKGEILTLHAPDWESSHIRIGAGGWLVPLGNGNFKAGSTYEWNTLDESPTAAGLDHVTRLARRLGGDGPLEVVAHEAGIRPILRRSEPRIGPLPQGGWMCNGLGSKGSLYAPGIAARLARWILDGREPEPEVDFRRLITT
jgi:glycine/D-amino acid oxidase-like deaminating enzyme